MSAIQKFDLFERRLRTARRRADRGQILDGEHDKKRGQENRGVFRCRHLGAFACVALFSSGMPASRFSSFRSPASLGDSAGSDRVIKR